MSITSWRQHAQAQTSLDSHCQAAMPLPILSGMASCHCIVHAAQWCQCKCQLQCMATSAQRRDPAKVRAHVSTELGAMSRSCGIETQHLNVKFCTEQ